AREVDDSPRPRSARRESVRRRETPRHPPQHPPAEDAGVRHRQRTPAPQARRQGCQSPQTKELRGLSIDLLIFDLDGTLVDSRLDLANSVNATLRHMGMETLANERVYTYVGNGAPMLIRRALGEGATEAQVEEALEFFLEFYREHDLDHTVLYPGVKESLDRLRAAGKKMAVLTNKPVRMSRHIVEGLGVADHFFRVYGGN